MKGNEVDVSTKKKCIMIVDDDEAIRMLVGGYFEKDFDTVLMSDGHEALIYISENRVPDLILLDMEMPNMNGRVFLRRIRYGNAKFNKIPIIFLTTVSSKLIVQSAFKHGVEDYIFKPFKKEELVKKVIALLYSNSN